MTPRTSAAVASSMWNLTSLLQTLPSSTTAQASAFTKCSACLFSSSAHLESIKKRRNKKKITDPYRAAQAKQRKTANIAKQAALQAERQTSMGDPIRSRPTPFVQSLRGSPTRNNVPANNEEHINFYLNPKSMADQLAQSKWLTEPIPQSQISGTNNVVDTRVHEQALQEHDSQHANATRALQSITSLATGSSKDRTRMNVQRCINEFGRHTTDAVLPPKPSSIPSSTARPPPLLSESEAAAAAELAALPKRVGNDTGSSEVQVAILTTKINALADNLHKKDKTNKRNLRLLVHRRQKLLSYLHRKERGGPRWTNLVEKLGINDAMWKGEISL